MGEQKDGNDTPRGYHDEVVKAANEVIEEVFNPQGLDASKDLQRYIREATMGLSYFQGDSGVREYSQLIAESLTTIQPHSGTIAGVNSAGEAIEALAFEQAQADVRMAVVQFGSPEGVTEYPIDYGDRPIR